MVSIITRNSDVPLTGIFIDIFPYIVLFLLGIFGIIIIIKSKKDSDNDK